MRPCKALTRAVDWRTPNTRQRAGGTSHNLTAWSQVMSDSIVAELRTCNTCGIAKPLTEYHRNKNSAGGRLPRCKACRKIADAPYVAAHMDVIRARAAQWRKQNPELAAEKNRRWALANRDRTRAASKRYRASEKGRRYNATYRPPQESRRAAIRRYYDKNLDKYRQYRRNRRARVRGAGGSHTAADVEEIGRLQRWKCAACGLRLGRDMEVDHRTPIARGGTNDRLNLQLLHSRCNRSKGALDPIEHARRLGRLL